MKQTVEAIREEYGFNPNDPETLTMHEKADADGVTRKHWHLVRPAQDSDTGRTYKLYRSKGKDEAICRRMELELGHRLMSGAHNAFAEKRLREMSKDDLADKVAELDTANRAAFSSDQHQQAKRNDFDLPALRQSLKEIAQLDDRAEQAEKLAELIDREHLELNDAIFAGRGRSRIMLELPGDQPDHNANRTLKLKAAEVAAFINETKEALNAIRSDTDRRDALAGSTADNHCRPKADTRRTEADTPRPQGADQTPERHSGRIQGDQQELTPTSISIKNSDNQALASAAAELRPQIQRHKSSAIHAGDLDSIEVEPAPDANDPNLLKKLSAMLARAMRKSTDAAKQMLGPSQGMPG